MLKMTLLAVGGLKESWWREAQEEYRRRLAPFAKLEIVEVEPMPTTATVAAAKSMAVEGERLAKRLSGDALVVALERGGKEWSSEEVAAFLAEAEASGQPVAFVVGGSEGLAPEVLARAQRKWSLSRLTFPHEMARVVLLEQVYRGFCIKAGKAYHK